MSCLPTRFHSSQAVNIVRSLAYRSPLLNVLSITCSATGPHYCQPDSKIVPVTSARQVIGNEIGRRSIVSKHERACGAGDGLNLREVHCLRSLCGVPQQRGQRVHFSHPCSAVFIPAAKQISRFGWFNQSYLNNFFAIWRVCGFVSQVYLGVPDQMDEIGVGKVRTVCFSPVRMANEHTERRKRAQLGPVSSLSSRRTASKYNSPGSSVPPG